MIFSVEPASRTPVFQQIIDQLEIAIAMGRVQPHHPLPTVRELALQLLINPNTVQKAFSELTRRGLIYSRKGIGMFTTEWKPTRPPTKPWEDLQPILDQFISQAILAGHGKKEIQELVEARLEEYRRGES